MLFHQINSRKYIILLLIGYAILFSMAIYFYQERLCIDTGHYFFNTINDQFFHVEHQRFVLAIAELPIVIGMYFKCNMQQLAMLYSCMPIFFFGLLGCSLYLFYNDIFAWLLLFFLQIVGYHIGFVNPIVEHYYGIGLCVVLYKILNGHSTISPLRFLLLQLIAAFILTSHPFAILLYLFVLIFIYLDKKNSRLMLSMLIIIPFYLVFKSKFASPYEKDKSAWIFDIANNKTYLELFTTHLWIQFAKLLLIHYWHWLILFATTIFYFIKNKKYQHAIVVLFFTIISTILIQFAYAIKTYGGSEEQELFTLMPYTLFPFFLIVLPKIKYSNVIAVGLGSIAMVSIALQLQIINVYTAKTIRVKQWITKARQLPGNTFSILPNTFSDIDNLIDWDVPFFTLLISSFDGGKQVTIVPLTGTNEQLINTLLPNQYLYRSNEIAQIDKLNKNYFYISNKGYLRLE